VAAERAWERTRASGKADPLAYAAAGDAWTTLDPSLPGEIMQFREAEAHVNAGERPAAANVAAAAHSAAMRIRAGWRRGEIEGLAARARLQLTRGDSAPEPGGEEVPTDDSYGLTSRERQVLELVARGATNREIGATLFMAEKTASVHLSRILAKLDVRTRTEAAGVAHRLGLVR
jgi:DNA-binding NarL/FixJ family response regulator